jgi:heme/copper-type cytochrome/quinol oxidase subunit 2
VPSDPQHHYQGLGFRAVTINTATHELTVTKYPLARAGREHDAAGRLHDNFHRRPAGKYTLSEIHMPRGVPVTLELTSLDTLHGFSVPDPNIDAFIVPGQTTRECDFVYDRSCGEGPESMVGKIVVE